MSTKETHELKIKISNEVLRGTYANTLLVSHTAEEFVLDFILSLPPQAACNARVLLSPRHLKRIIHALQKNLAAYEAQHGSVAESRTPAGGGSASPIDPRRAARRAAPFSGRGVLPSSRPRGPTGIRLQWGTTTRGRDRMAKTVTQAFLETVRRWPDRPALRVRDGERFRSIPYRDLHERVQALGTALLDLGLRPRDTVGLIADNRPEWILCRPRLRLRRRRRTSPGAATPPRKEIEYILGHADTVAAFVEDERAARQGPAFRGACRSFLSRGHGPGVGGAGAPRASSGSGAVRAAAARSSPAATAVAEERRRRQARRPGDHHLHLRHHGRAQGRGARAPQHHAQRAAVPPLLAITGEDRFLSCSRPGTSSSAPWSTFSSRWAPRGLHHHEDVRRRHGRWNSRPSSPRCRASGRGSTARLPPPWPRSRREAEAVRAPAGRAAGSARRQEGPVQGGHRLRAAPAFARGTSDPGALGTVSCSCAALPLRTEEVRRRPRPHRRAAAGRRSPGAAPCPPTWTTSSPPSASPSARATASPRPPRCSTSATSATSSSAPSARRCRGPRSGSSTTRGATCRPGRRGSSSAAAVRSWPATTSAPTRPRRSSPPTAGSTRATWAASPCAASSPSRGRAKETIVLSGGENVEPDPHRGRDHREPLHRPGHGRRPGPEALGALVVPESRGRARVAPLPGGRRAS